MIEYAVLLQHTSNQTLHNASSSLQGSVNSAWGLFPVLGVVLIAVAAVFVGSEVQRIEWLHDKLKTFSASLYYTAIGLASTLVVGVLVAPMYYLSRADGQTQKYVLYAIGGLLVAYIVFTGLGYVVDRTILSNVREYRDSIETVETGD